MATEDSPNSPIEIPDDAVDLIRQADWITVFSGAGMSADSGVPTFRDAHTALWERYSAEDLASVDAWHHDPALVWSWYHWRTRLVRQAQPNAGHRALADLGRHSAVMVVTQNVDDLHERAGSTVISHLHGSLFAPRCADCGTPYDATDNDKDAPAEEPLRLEPPRCPVCGGAVRPGVVWFGENLPTEAWTRAEQAILGSDVLLVIGTSGVVYPAASLPERAVRQGIPVIEVNPDESALTALATHRIAASAARGVPELVRRVVGV